MMDRAVFIVVMGTQILIFVIDLIDTQNRIV